MGDNGYGELGIENTKFEKMLTKIEYFNINRAPKKVCSGARHSLVLTEKGKLYAFGDNSDGQCSGFNECYYKPTRVRFKQDEIIVDIACGYNHSIAISNKGNVYTWGDSTNGKLGYNVSLSSVTIPRVVPVSEKNVSFIAGGYQQSLVITSEKKKNDTILNIK